MNTLKFIALAVVMLAAVSALGIGLWQICPELASALAIPLGAAGGFGAVVIAVELEWLDI